MTIGYKTKKLFSQKMPKKLKIFSLKILKGAAIKKIETFLYKSTKHKKNYMGCLNSKNKNTKDGGSL